MEALTLFPSSGDANPMSGTSRRPDPPFKLIFPQGLIDAAARHLRIRGTDGCEELVLFAGIPVDGEVLITALLLPQTDASWGHVDIVKSEQPVITDWLVAHRHLLFVESHTHGGRSAWSTKISGVDTAYPVSIRDGFLTVIVPAHAEDGIDFMNAGVWECRKLKWRRLAKRQVAERFAVFSDDEVRGRLG